MERRSIAFSPPDITELEIQEVAEALRSGWITTGPRTKQLEKNLAEYCHTNKVVCLNSATAAEELNLRVLGIGEGDEVLVPAYTYTASASAAIHCGATVKFIDSQKDSVEMDYDAMEAAITEKTKAVITVDLGGIPCDYDRIYQAVERKKALFRPANSIQKAIGRVIVVADCAHALGAERLGKMAGEIADFTSFSFHAVKNFTTAEGGASTWKSIPGIDDEWEKIITGFMYYYGFIETRTLYSLFLKVSKKVISYEDFLLFIKCRTSLWPFGAILKDTFEKNEYFQYLNVENPDMLLEYVRQHENLPYKPIKLEDLIYVSDAAGIDNRWRGVSELGNLFIDKMGLNYYRATVLVRTLLIMIKNGSSYEKLQEKVSILSFENAQIREEVQQAVRQIFENVPVFEYKGYSRAEYKRLSYQKQLKKRKNLFTIIDGGKE